MAEKKNYIVIYKDDFCNDVWEEYCKVCKVPVGASEITIRFSDEDREYAIDEFEPESGHTMSEIDAMSELREEWCCWDFPIEELKDGTIEPRDDCDYWLIGDRVYEVPKDR